MTFLQFVGAGLALTFLVYITARLITAAYFKSKEDHERKKHGTKQTQPR